MSRLKVTIDRTAEFRRAIRALVQDQVLVGIPAENSDRQADAEDPHPMSNAAIGYLMETGSPAQNIPARPFLVPGVQDASDQIAQHLGAAAKAALSGDPSAAEKGLTRAGLAAVSAVQAKISNGPFEPLKPETVRRRKTRKQAPRDSDKPLVDSGQLRRAVTHVIRPAKGKR